MANFSANQYDEAFKPTKLQNWTVPKRHTTKEKPSPAEGHTVFIATDRGHLLPGVKRGRLWTPFQGTWDLPSHIPPVHINPTARSQEGQQRLRAWGQIQRQVSSATDKLNKTNENKTQQCQDTGADNQHEGLFVNNSPRDGPQHTSQASQVHSRPATQQSHGPSRPATQQSHGPSRPATQQSQEPSRPATPQSHAPSRAGTPQSQAPSRAATPQSQAPSRAATPQSQAPSRAATPQSQAPSRAATPQSHAQVQITNADQKTLVQTSTQD